MENFFDISQFDSYKEDNRREVKRANGGLPNDMWETYSAYANTYGGVIILGVKELDDKHWRTTGLKLKDKEKLLDDLWNLLHNRNKVNINLLTESDVQTYDVGEDIIIVITVPMAKYNGSVVKTKGRDDRDVELFSWDSCIRRLSRD